MSSDDFFDEFDKMMKKQMKNMFNFGGFFNFGSDFGQEKDEEDTTMPKDAFDLNHQFRINDDKAEKNAKRFSMAYRFGTGMDKPEIKVEGNLPEEELKKIAESMMKNGSFGFNFGLPAGMAPKADVLDFKELNDKMEEEQTEGPKAIPEIHPKAKAAKESVHINKELIEPYADVIEETDQFKLIMEIPGVDQKDIRVFVNPSNTQEVHIIAENEYARYEKTVELTKKINPGKISGTAKNGIITFTISLEK